MKILLAVFLLFSLSAQAESESICSTQGISSFDPAKVQDDLGGRIMHNFAPMLLRPGGGPTELVKAVRQEGDKLIIELNDALEWQERGSFKPRSKLSPEDVVTTFTRPRDQIRNFVTYQMNVGQYLKSVAKTGNSEVSFTFNPGSEPKKILSKPQAAIVSAEYIKFLEAKKEPTSIEKFPTFLKGTSLRYVSARNFVLTKGKDTYQFFLGLSDRELKARLVKGECDQILDISPIKGRKIANVFGFTTSPSGLRKYMFLAVNPTIFPGSNSEFRKLAAELAKSFTEPRTIRELEPKRVIPAGTFNPKSYTESLEKFAGVPILIAFTYGDYFYKTGGMDFLSAITDEFERQRLYYQTFVVDEESYLTSLNSGGYVLSVVTTSNPQLFSSCFLPAREHPLQSCGTLEELKKGNTLVPLYEWQNLDLSSKKKTALFR